MKRSRLFFGICFIVISLCSALVSRGGAQQTPPPYPAQQCGTSGSDATIIGRLPAKASSAYYAQDSVSGYIVGTSGASQYLSLIKSIASPYPSVASGSSTSPPTISTTALTQTLQYANFQPAIPGSSIYQFTCHSLPRYTSYQFIATVYQPFSSCDTMGNVKPVEITYYYLASGQTFGKNSTTYINPNKWSLIGTHPTVAGIPTPPCYPPGSTPGP
jgi:hypothetical protein